MPQEFLTVTPWETPPGEDGCGALPMSTVLDGILNIIDQEIKSRLCVLDSTLLQERLDEAKQSEDLDTLISFASQLRDARVLQALGEEFNASVESLKNVVTKLRMGERSIQVFPALVIPEVTDNREKINPKKYKEYSGPRVMLALIAFSKDDGSFIHHRKGLKTIAKTILRPQFLADKMSIHNAANDVYAIRRYHNERIAEESKDYPSIAAYCQAKMFALKMVGMEGSLWYEFYRQVQSAFGVLPPDIFIKTVLGRSFLKVDKDLRVLESWGTR